MSESSDRAGIFLASNGKCFPPEKMAIVKSKLGALDENRFILATSLDLKDPATMLII